MGEEHLDLLSSPLCGRVELGGRAEPREVSDDLIFFSTNAARRGVRAAFRFRRASLAIEFQTAILTATRFGFVSAGVGIIPPCVV